MPKLINGDQLNERQRQEVLMAFVHRWTHENAKQTYNGQCPACIQLEQLPWDYSDICVDKEGKESPYHSYHLPIISDAEWLKQHAFWVRKDGRLCHGRRIMPAIKDTENEKE